MAMRHPKLIAGRYELKALPMPGGMGLVWEGYDTVLDRPVAIKQIRADKAHTAGQRAELVSRFRREAKVTARIEHPGVPAVHDAAIDKSADSPGAVAELYQFLAGVGVSPRSDLYALGCVLHEMLVGEKVFDGRSDPALQHVPEDPVPLRVLRPEVPAALERLVLDLLAKAPENRPDSAQEVHKNASFRISR